jgi:hypothetical protein
MTWKSENNSFIYVNKIDLKLYMWKLTLRAAAYGNREHLRTEHLNFVSTYI